MGIFNKLWTLVRGKASESGQAIVDANAITILEQEVRDADSSIHDAKTELAQLQGKRSVVANRLTENKTKHSTLDKQIQECLAKNNEGLATEVATKISEIEAVIKDDEKTLNMYDTVSVNLKDKIKLAETRIQNIKNKITTAKANESIIKATQQIAGAHSGANSSLASASDSLQHITESQTERMGAAEAAFQMDKEADGTALEEKLAAAGIGGATSADDVLARYKKPTT
jgi:phage shock protein A